MPANQGKTSANWKPLPDFKRSVDETHAMLERSWQPKSPALLAQFLCTHAVLPEMEGYQDQPDALKSIAEYIAEIMWLPDCTVDDLIRHYEAEQTTAIA